jgi:hypothetical protein
VTIVGVFSPVTVGDNAYVNGQLFGDGQAGQVVILEHASPPAFTDWTPIAQVGADAQGYYSFKLRPTQTMQYRTSSQGTNSERGVLVGVGARVKLHASPAGKTSVRFSGKISPGFAGQTIEIQRQLRSGAWTRAATARLRGGRSFAGRLRTRHSVALRAFYPASDQYVASTSRTVNVNRTANAATARAAACRAPSITRITTNPSPLLARRSMALHVSAALTGGRVYAIDVLWGEGGKRDHFTLARSQRKAKATFTLTHRYATPGDYKTRIKVLGRTSGCSASTTKRPTLQVTRAPEQYQP